MLEEHRTARLRGFDTAVADIGDQLHLCHPLLSFEGESTLYVARRLDWKNDPKALAVADASEASALATLLPDTHTQPITSGEAVVAVGTPFARAATVAGIQLDGSGIEFSSIHDAECRIGVATPARFMKIKTRLANKALITFDEELGDAARLGDRLSERGNAALLLLRRCGPRRRDDLAIRQLAGARQNREFDLYRRLLIRFALELHTQENDLDERARRHISSTASALPPTTFPLQSGLEYSLESLPYPRVSIFTHDSLWSKSGSHQKRRRRQRAEDVRLIKREKDVHSKERIQQYIDYTHYLSLPYKSHFFVSPLHTSELPGQATARLSKKQQETTRDHFLRYLYHKTTEQKKLRKAVAWP